MAEFFFSDFDVEDSPVVETEDQRILTIPKPIGVEVDDEEHSRFVLSEFYKNKEGRPLGSKELRAQVIADFGEEATYKDAHTQQSELSNMVSKGPAKSLVIDPARHQLVATEPKPLGWKQMFKTRQETFGRVYQSEVGEAKRRLGKGLSKEDRGDQDTDAQALARYKENFSDWDDNSLHLKAYNSPLRVESGKPLEVTPERREQMLKTLMERDVEFLREDEQRQAILSQKKTASGHAANTILNVRDMASYMAEFALFGGSNILLMGLESQEQRAAGDGFIDPKTGSYVLTKEQQGVMESYIKGGIDGAVNYTIEKYLAKVGGVIGKGAKRLGIKNPLARLSGTKIDLLSKEIRKTIQNALPKKAGAVSEAASKISKKAGLNSLVEEIFVEEYLQAMYEGIEDSRSLTAEGEEQGLLKSEMSALKSVIVGTPEMSVTFGLFGLTRGAATRQMSRASLMNAKKEWMASRNVAEADQARILDIEDDKELGKELVSIESAHLDQVFEDEAPTIVEDTGLSEEEVRVALLSSDPEVRKQNVAELVEEQEQAAAPVEEVPAPEALEITEPQTASQLVNLVNHVGGEDVFMESSDDKELATLALDAARGDSEALLTFNQKIIGDGLSISDFDMTEGDQEYSDIVDSVNGASGISDGVGDGEIIQSVDEENGQLLTGVSRKFNNQFLAEMGRQELSKPDRVENVQTMQAAKNAGLDAEAEANATRVLDPNDNLTQLSKDQVAGLLIRKGEIQNEIDSLQQEILDAAGTGDDAAFDSLTDRLDGLVSRGVALTEAARRAGTENARSLQAMAMVMDRKTFNLVNIIAEASRSKGSMLTKKQNAKFTAMASDLKQWEELATSLQEEVDALELQRAQEIAAGVVVDELSKTRASKKRKSTSKTREAAKAELEKLGYQVNDITGLPFKASKQLAKIAVSYIQDGATTLEEVVTRVQSDVPDVSPKNIYDALGGRVKKDSSRIRSEVDDRISELKTQARLTGEIDDAVNGLLTGTQSAKETSDTVAKLKKDLKELSASVVQTERDSTRASAILDRVAELGEVIDGKRERERRVKRLDSKELKAAKSKLSVANKELSAKDRIEVLKEILDVGRQPREKADRGETSERLEEFRAQITVLEGKIKAREATKNDQARLDAVIGEVEGFYRNIVEQKKKLPKNATQEEIAKYEQAKRDQDTIVDLLESLRTRTVKATKKRGKKADPFGYKEMISNLRKEITDSEWYEELKTTQREIAALSRTQENIAKMEADLKAGNLDPYITTTQQRVIKSEELIKARLREHQLKKEISRKIRELRPKTWVDRASDIWDIPRTAKLTADVGHIWRQGGFFLSNPVKINPATFTWRSLKAFGEAQADALDLKVLNSDYYVDAQLAGLHLISEGDSLDQREEILMDNMLDHMKGLGRPVSVVINASGRTQITSMNVLRMQLFEGMNKRNPNATAEEQKDFAWAINILTGYGQGENVDALSRSKVLNKLLISTRFTSSRFQGPTMLFRPRVWKNKALRKELIEDTLAYWALRSTIFFIATKLWPDTVSIGTNPDHHTRGKLIVDLGNDQSRVYDPWSGLSKITNVLATSAKGKDTPLVAAAYELTKSGHPMISGLWGVLTGTKYPNEESGRLEAAARMITPISIEGFIDSYRDDTGILDAFFSTALDVGGINSYVVDNEDLEGKTEWDDRKPLKERINIEDE